MLCIRTFKRDCSCSILEVRGECILLCIALVVISKSEHAHLYASVSLSSMGKLLVKRISDMCVYLPWEDLLV